MKTSSEILEKLGSINANDYDEVFLRRVELWKKSIGEIEAVRALADHFVIKGMVAAHQVRIKEINDLLLNQRKMDVIDREMLLNERDVISNFLVTFDADLRLQHLAGEVAYELE